MTVNTASSNHDGMNGQGPVVELIEWKKVEIVISGLISDMFGG